MEYAEFERKVKRLDPSDTCVREIDGKPETMLSMRGVILIAYQTWIQEPTPQCQGVLWEYCRYICSRGYAGGATKALNNLSKMSKAQGERWIVRTFDQYVHDEMRLLKALGFRPSK